MEVEVILEPFSKFYCSQRICTVSVSDKLKVFRKFCKALECHTHGKDAGTNATVVGYLIANDGAGGSVHDEPDVSFDASDFYVSLIGCENVPFFVRVLINKGFDADSSSLTVVGDLLVRDCDVIKVFESLSGFAEREPEIDMEGKAQRHDVGIVFAEL